MMNDFNLFKEMSAAAQNLSSVKRPLPERFSEQQVEQAIDKIQGLFDSDELLMVDASMDEIAMYTTLIVSTQVLVFNRALNQITAASLADSVAVVMPRIQPKQSALIEIAEITLQLSRYLIQQRLVPATIDDDYLELLNKQRPDLTTAISDNLFLPEEDMTQSTSSNIYFDNWPIMLVDDCQTTLYAQSGSYQVDFNDFIDEVANRHSPAQLQLAYTLFFGDQPLYQFLLNCGNPLVDSSQKYMSESLPFSFQMKLTFSRGLTSAGVIMFAKVIHQFLKFCLNRQLLTARDYASLLKLSNRGLIRAAVVRHIEDVNTILSQSATGDGLADKIFTRPNYTIDVAAAKKELAQLDMTPRATPINPDAKLELKRALSVRQIENELQKAAVWIAKLESMVGDAVSSQTKKIYRTAMLQVHQTMLQSYHRQTKHWTRDSLMAALQALFQSNRDLDQYPAFLRYWEAYLSVIDDEGGLTSYMALIDGLQWCGLEYLCRSANALTNR